MSPAYETSASRSASYSGGGPGPPSSESSCPMPARAPEAVPAQRAIRTAPHSTGAAVPNLIGMAPAYHRRPARVAPISPAMGQSE